MREEWFDYCLGEYERKVGNINAHKFMALITAVHVLDELERDMKSSRVPLPKTIIVPSISNDEYTIEEIVKFRMAYVDFQIEFMSRKNYELLNSAFFSDCGTHFEYAYSISAASVPGLTMDMNKQIACGEPGFNCYNIEEVVHMISSGIPLREDELVNMLPPCAKIDSSDDGRLSISEYNNFNEDDPASADDVTYETIDNAFEDY